MEKDDFLQLGQIVEICTVKRNCQFYCFYLRSIFLTWFFDIFRFVKGKHRPLSADSIKKPLQDTHFLPLELFFCIIIYGFLLFATRLVRKKKVVSFTHFCLWNTYVVRSWMDGLERADKVTLKKAYSFASFDRKSSRRLAQQRANEFLQNTFIPIPSHRSNFLWWCDKIRVRKMRKWKEIWVFCAMLIQIEMRRNQVKDFCAIFCSDFPPPLFSDLL